MRARMGGHWWSYKNQRVKPSLNFFFEQLFIQLSSFEYCRCEHTLGNAAGEGQALTEAARAFLDAEKNCHDLQCPSFKEHLNAAINCYSHAIRVS